MLVAVVVLAAGVRAAAEEWSRCFVCWPKVIGRPAESEQLLPYSRFSSGRLKCRLLFDGRATTERQL